MLRDRKKVFLFVFVVAFAFLAGNAAVAGNLTIVYPTQEDPVFSVTAPDSWEMTPAEEEGDFFLLEGPTGAVLSFRAISGTKDDMDAAVEEAIEYLKETYDKVQITDTTPKGVDASSAKGTGAYKEDGSPCVFGLGWFALKSGYIAELWFEAEAGDKEGAAEANKILSSFKEL